MNIAGKYPPMTAEENEALLALSDSLLGKSETPVSALWPKIRLLPIQLKRFKEEHGADWVRAMGFNTEFADLEYGPGWLDE